jgi:hypothetical protein
MGGYPGWKDFDPTKRKLDQAATPKRHKYGAKPHAVLPTLEVVEGSPGGPALQFSSKREALRYVELRNDPDVVNLQLQPRFPLTVTTSAGVKVCIGEYVADFKYARRNVGEVIEDAKGMRTPVYKWKKRHVVAEHGIRIQEV